MKAMLLSALILLGLNGKAQENYIANLKLKLDSILQTDQGIREYLDTETKEARKDSLARQLGYSREVLDKGAWTIMKKIDSTNIIRTEQIVAKYGYPGKTMVGEPLNTAVFYAVQHSGKISEYYPLIEKAGKSGELPFTFVAMMLDRKLNNEGKEQIYGTQIFMQMIKNPKTGKKEPFEYVVPIKDPKNVNKRRKQAGFDLTVEDNALRFGIIYKPYTLAEIKAITKQN